MEVLEAIFTMWDTLPVTQPSASKQRSLILHCTCARPVQTVKLTVSQLSLPHRKAYCIELAKILQWF